MTENNNKCIIYYTDFIDIKIIAYLIRCYLGYKVSYKAVLNYMCNNFNNLVKHDNIKIYFNKNNYIFFEYNRKKINYDILRNYNIDSDEFNNEIINNTKQLIIYLNNKYIIYNIVPNKCITLL